MLQILTIVTSLAAEQPAYPQWPDQFTATFNETLHLPGFGTSETSGTFYYDFTNLKARTDREDGGYDRYCGLNGLYVFYNTPCTHYVSEGQRYLYYPDYKQCCKCCTAASGCGLVKPTWLEGAEYLGTTELLGKQAYKWNQPGLQNNYYLETQATEPLDREMLEIDQVGTSDAIYPTFTKGVENEDVFDLPEECEDAGGCSWFSTCFAANHF